MGSTKNSKAPVASPFRHLASPAFGTAWGSYTAKELRERGAAIIASARASGASPVQVRSISAAIAHAEALADPGEA